MSKKTKQLTVDDVEDRVEELQISIAESAGKKKMSMEFSSRGGWSGEVIVVFVVTGNDTIKQFKSIEDAVDAYNAL